MLMRTFVRDIFHLICNCVICYRKQWEWVGGLEDEGIFHACWRCGADTMAIWRAGGRWGPNRESRLPLHTHTWSQVSVCVCVCVCVWRVTDREGFSTRNITSIKRVCLYDHLIHRHTSVSCLCLYNRTSDKKNELRNRSETVKRWQMERDVCDD